MTISSNTLLLNTLIEFGLSEKEAKIYITLLEFEVASVQQIAKVSGINRSSAYVVLESLKHKGLVSISEDKNVQQYIPTSPNVLIKTAEAMANKQEQIKKNIDAIVPDLKALHRGMKQKPIIRVFEGRDGLISLLEDSFTSKEKLLRTATSAKNLSGILAPEVYQNYMKQRIDEKIIVHGIHPVDKFTYKILEVSPVSGDKQVLIPESEYKFPSNIAIYDNKVAYMSPNNGGIGILIESSEMAEVMKSVFDLAFLGAEKIGKKYTHKKK